MTEKCDICCEEKQSFTVERPAGLRICYDCKQAIVAWRRPSEISDLFAVARVVVQKHFQMLLDRNKKITCFRQILEAERANEHSWN